MPSLTLKSHRISLRGCLLSASITLRMCPYILKYDPCWRQLVSRLDYYYSNLSLQAGARSTIQSFRFLIRMHTALVKPRLSGHSPQRAVPPSLSIQQTTQVSSSQFNLTITFTLTAQCLTSRRFRNVFIMECMRVSKSHWNITWSHWHPDILTTETGLH